MSIRPAAVPLLVLMGACGPGGSDQTALQVERETLGDTLVVRTVAGQAWAADATLEPEMRLGTFEGEEVYMLGEVNGMAIAADGSIYLYDRQIQALRKYSPEGEYIATFGREGSGPGEYRQSDGGLAVLPDGRVLLRDPGNARINIYSPAGETLGHWPLRGGYFTSRPLFVDTAGITYTQIWGSNEDGERYSGLQRIGSNGESLDSILVPEWDYEPATISLSRERMRMTNIVPFAPRSMWTMHPHGYVVGGISSDYSFDLFRPDGSVLRIQRVVDPVRVERDEAENARARAAAAFRRAAPDWQWNGPGLPDTKPAYAGIQTGRDGRLWLQTSQPGTRIPVEDDADTSDDPNAAPPARWKEAVVYDVFEPDGTYLGAVHTPDGFSVYPTPIFDRDHVWAVVRDELEVQYLTRFRITPAGGEFRTE